MDDYKIKLDGMRAAGRACKDLLDHLAPLAIPGTTTESINEEARSFIEERGWLAAPFQYAPPGARSPFPKHLCASVNHQVCHGIPGEKILKSGDLLKLDCTVIVDGWHGDSCRSFIVGDDGRSSKFQAARRLSELTKEAMFEGIRSAKAGEPLSSIGRAIEKFAKKHGLGIVRDYCGHGIGLEFHGFPTVRAYREPSDDEIIIEEGWTFTIEPMLCLGSGATTILNDGWTVATKDKTLSAQWEHTLVIQPTQAEILTA